jgi:hypothetical protein
VWLMTRGARVPAVLGFLTAEFTAAGQKHA